MVRQKHANNSLNDINRPCNRAMSDLWEISRSIFNYLTQFITNLLFKISIKSASGSIRRPDTTGPNTSLVYDFGWYELSCFAVYEKDSTKDRVNQQ